MTNSNTISELTTRELATLKAPPDLLSSRTHFDNCQRQPRIRMLPVFCCYGHCLSTLIKQWDQEQTSHVLPTPLLLHTTLNTQENGHGLLLMKYSAFPQQFLSSKNSQGQGDGLYLTVTFQVQLKFTCCLSWILVAAKSENVLFYSPTSEVQGGPLGELLNSVWFCSPSPGLSE